MSYDAASAIFKTVGHPLRLQLLYAVASGCTSSNDLATRFGVTSPTVTHHMKKLIAAGLVRREQQGKWAHYTVNQPLFEQLDSLVQCA